MSHLITAFPAPDMMAICTRMALHCTLCNTLQLSLATKYCRTFHKLVHDPLLKAEDDVKRLSSATDAGAGGKCLVNIPASHPSTSGFTAKLHWQPGPESIRGARHLGFFLSEGARSQKQLHKRIASPFKHAPGTGDPTKESAPCCNCHGFQTMARIPDKPGVSWSPLLSSNPRTIMMIRSVRIAGMTQDLPAPAVPHHQSLQSTNKAAGGCSR